MWLDLKGELSRALGTEVKPSVGRLRLLLAVATSAHVALIFPVAVFLVCWREMGRGGENLVLATWAPVYRYV